MRKRSPVHYTFLMPLILLVFFSLSAISVVLFSARTYSHIVDRSRQGADLSLAMRYVRAKIHQYDSEGALECGSFDGQDALLLHETINDHTYTTYLYCYDGSLCELYLADGTKASAASGMPVVDMLAFKAEENGNLLRISLIDKDGNSLQDYTALQCGKERE